MSSLLVKRFSSFSPSSFHQRHHHLALPIPLLRLSFSTQPSEQKENNFLAKYLISSLGFPPDRALKVSICRQVAAIKSEVQPESVVRFLEDTGLSGAQIKSVISFYPALLASNVEKTLRPKVRTLTDAGFSGEILVQLIRNNPHILLMKNILLRLRFWRDFTGNDDRDLLKIIQKNCLLITCDVDKHVVPRINLLKEYGLSNSYIVLLLKCGTRCLNQNLDSLRQTLELTEELGIPRGSKMFPYGVRAVASCSKDRIKRNAEVFKTRYGWLQEEVYTAFRQHPSILAFSEEKVKSNMNFLIGKAGFEVRSTALYPSLIMCSVERVLIPRYTVLSALEAEGLLKGKGKNCCLAMVCKMSQKSFYENYVVPFEKHVPGLSEAYIAAYGVKKQV